jgi:hypothetical protein
VENRNSLVVYVTLTQATGTAEWGSALDMLKGVHGSRRLALGVDRGYGYTRFCYHWSANERDTACGQPQGVEVSWTHQPGIPDIRLAKDYAKRVEDIFGWVKTTDGGRKLRFYGVERNQLRWELNAAAHNLFADS